MTIKVICVVAVSGVLAMTTQDRARDGGLSASVKSLFSWHRFADDMVSDVGSFITSPIKLSEDALCDTLDPACAVKNAIDDVTKHIKASIPGSQALDLQKFPLKYQQAYAMLINAILSNRLKAATPVEGPGSELIGGAINAFLTKIFEKRDFPIANLLGVNLPTSQAELKSKIPQGMSPRLANAVWTLWYASRGRLGQLADIMQGPANSVSAQTATWDGGSDLMGDSFVQSGWDEFAQACANLYRRIINYLRRGSNSPPADDADGDAASAGDAGAGGAEGAASPGAGSNLACSESRVVSDIASEGMAEGQAQNSALVGEIEELKNLLKTFESDSVDTDSPYNELLNQGFLDEDDAFTHYDTDDIHDAFDQIYEQIPALGEEIQADVDAVDEMLDGFGA